MASKTNKNTVRTANGGTVTIERGTNGNAFRITVTQGYKETPEERRERLAAGNRARRFNSRKDKGGRQGANACAIRDFA